MAISMAKFARKASNDNSPEELQSLDILAQSWEAKGNLKNAKYVYNLLVEKYPDSEEAKHARMVIKQ